MTTRDPRLDLIVAYREAGLAEKADALTQELLQEELGVTSSAGLKAKADAILGDLDKAMDGLADKLGVPRRPRKRRR